MTDKQLYRLCKKYGARVLAARRRFAGLLPEVERRRLWERRGFSSVYELAARLGGLTRQQVDEVLRLERRFVQMPVLRLALVRGEVSVGKLARVASVASAENSGQILRMARELSYAALDLKVKEIKIENGLMRSTAGGKSLCAQSGERVAERGGGDEECAGDSGCSEGSGVEGEGRTEGRAAAETTLADLGISAEVAAKLLLLRAQGRNLNVLLEKALAAWPEGKRSNASALEVTVAGEESQKIEEKNALEERWLQEKMKLEIRDRTRWVPQRVKKLLLQKFGGRCAVDVCGKPAEQIHHLREWARGGGHDPANLRPLCRGHHQLAHWRR